MYRRERIKFNKASLFNLTWLKALNILSHRTEIKKDTAVGLEIQKVGICYTNVPIGEFNSDSKFVVFYSLHDLRPAEGLC